MSTQDLKFGLFTEKCYDTFFVDYNMLDQACLTLFLSKLAGYGIILGAVFVKFPQILKIVQAGNVEGINPSMFITETISYTITACYNLRMGYPFSTYGENVALTVQGVILILLMFHYMKQLNIFFFSCAAIYIAMVAASLANMVSTEMLTYANMSTIPLMIFSRIPQIMTNFKNKSTGQLAFITLLLNFVGVSVRLFTVFTEVDDPLILLSILLGVLLNGILLIQTLLYTKPAIKKD